MKYILCTVVPDGYEFHTSNEDWRKVAPLSREICLANKFDPESYVQGNVYRTYHNLSAEFIAKAYIDGQPCSLRIENPMNIEMG